MRDILLSVNDLKTYFPISKGLFRNRDEVIKAVDGVSFQLQKGETLGLVGESGCGKSTTGRSIMRLIEPTSGTIEFEGQNISEMSATRFRPLRKRMQIVFQDPYASLNPRMTVQGALEEALGVRDPQMSAKERRDQVKELLQMVGLNAQYATRFPHEFSGGQRQRIGIARALAVEPSLIVADEPVSALDVSIQAQIVNLLQDLQQRLGLSYLFISHDLGVVRHISDRIAVMYLGRIVEIASKKDLFLRPLHPYTEALMSAVPKANPFRKKERIVLSGDVPSPANVPVGCAFHTRCSYATEICRTVRPVATLASPQHYVACHLYGIEGMKYIENRTN
ncbi:peptide ABC transporter substrate-binding protein [Brevibacillus brevis]|uniref:ABC transporter ATP-binding protein n=1 Tax=Brevibacillus brevis TaxID=1393 RepID=UPI0019018160|nr:dipeptide ABC transporter ATP-binding protein [Brevibacillus brevis]MBH0330768.1 peptide ABC transporter substrate-binding protein [Brevibacillus brevis]